jgi:hypothetical protein
MAPILLHAALGAGVLLVLLVLLVLHGGKRSRGVVRRIVRSREGLSSSRPRTT